MSRSPEQRIADVLEAVERCRKYVAALDRESDIAEMAEDAIERNLQIIGEAVNHLPDEITGAHLRSPGHRFGASATSWCTSTSESTSTWSAMSLRRICRLSSRRCVGTLPPTEGAVPKVFRLRNVVEFRFNV